jgi:hypothetical protein
MTRRPVNALLIRCVLMLSGCQEASDKRRLEMVGGDQEDRSHDRPLHAGEQVPRPVQGLVPERGTAVA